jgi:hypothetical protein
MLLVYDKSPTIIVVMNLSLWKPYNGKHDITHFSLDSGFFDN